MNSEYLLINIHIYMYGDRHNNTDEVKFRCRNLGIFDIKH